MSVAHLAPPPDWPKIMTRSGSPPNSAMLSRTHSSASTRSSMPHVARSRRSSAPPQLGQVEIAEERSGGGSASRRPRRRARRDARRRRVVVRPEPDEYAPPWMYTITGRFAASPDDGVHTLRNRQSSLVASANPGCGHAGPYSTGVQDLGPWLRRPGRHESPGPSIGAIANAAEYTHAVMQLATHPPGSSLRDDRARLRCVYRESERERGCRAGGAQQHAPGRVHHQMLSRSRRENCHVAQSRNSCGQAATGLPAIARSPNP